MNRIFIAYAQEDFEITNKIVTTLGKLNLDIWLDWKNLGKRLDLDNKIFKGIEETDAFLFLISPDSAKSKMCNFLIAHAAKNNKRILPIILRDTKVNTFLDELAKDEISKRNWIFCRESQDQFDKAIEEIQKTIRTDFEWVEIQRRLQVKALEWERNHRESSFLLRGTELKSAKSQIALNVKKDPHPTGLINQFILESQKNLESQRRSTRLRWGIVAGVSAALLLLIFFIPAGISNRYIYQPVDMEDYWVTIPAGEFLMGSNTESGAMPEHTVYISEYQIGKYETTNNQYNQCIRAGACNGTIVETELDHPVVDVNWFVAKTYCEWVGGRLPTEAEWEKAASWNSETNSKSIFPWGNTTADCSYANYFGKNGYTDYCVGGTTPVGSYEKGKSPYGLYDMAGNVYEWVYDLHTYDVSDLPSSNPRGPIYAPGYVHRVYRGGSWYPYFEIDIHTTTRFSSSPEEGAQYIGFRCALDIP